MDLANDPRMRVAVPLFHSRVSPRCITARKMVCAVVEGGDVVSREAVPLEIHAEEDLIERLLDLDIDVLVCGGIRWETVEGLGANGIRVLNNVAGDADEVLDVLAGGGLEPGYGLYLSAEVGGEVEGDGEGSPSADLPLVDCIACAGKPCMEGEGCSRDLDPAAVPRLAVGEWRFYEVGQEVSARADPAQCRISELIRFGTTMGYRRIGLAFCWEIFREIEALVPVLARHFEVVPVCCRVGSTAEDAGGSAGGMGTCQPLLQAALLERAGTQLNVTAGLCVGCDALFAARSHAPVTTLFVRDRTLAHNPMGAIYSRRHLDDVARQVGSNRS